MRVTVKKSGIVRGHDGDEACRTVYVDGKATVVIVPDRWGGPDDLEVLDEDRFKELMAHVKSLPPVQFHGRDLPMTLALFVYHLGKPAASRRNPTRAN